MLLIISTTHSVQHGVDGRSVWIRGRFSRKQWLMTDSFLLGNQRLWGLLRAGRSSHSSDRTGQIWPVQAACILYILRTSQSNTYTLRNNVTVFLVNTAPYVAADKLPPTWRHHFSTTFPNSVFALHHTFNVRLDSHPVEMSVLLETSVGDIVIDLLVDYAPKMCEK